ncbi:uncharacterized protein LOC119671107 isoform X1 [Teleopsis dalmanni]|uniref:uncharacterized protein LOC119671107 isoform X1 n=1 Tax=Teleopsis dalmanni TaxID=139649 RepID=UPI0018CF383D|nr:uncharacterized protein LOC119671107 isoform X1 [Teleopsis dalmanni]
MPTVRRCCIVGCLSNSRQSPQLQFFQFPRPENPVHNAWKQACHASLGRILPFKKPVVCALHFTSNCLGNRRLTSSAIPTLRLEVPTNLKAAEQQAMIDDIERSRKCAYINAVVYEWIVRANLNPQLRGSITHGMIKEKAESAKNVIDLNTFVVDNRWLNRFRETHLAGFAQKLNTNQLKPLGLSLWIPDIVQDLQHLFPATTAEHVAELECVPEQYVDYMQQYGEYEEDDYSDQKPEQSYQTEQQQEQSYQEQQQQSHYQKYNSFNQDPYEPQINYNYDNSNDELKSPGSNFSSPHPSRPSSHSPPQQQLLSNRSSPNHNPVKRPRVNSDEVQIVNSPPEQIDNLTNGSEINHNENGVSKQITNGSISNGHSNCSTPKPMNGKLNGHISPEIDDDCETYANALEKLKPIANFVLSKENFRAIGLISQLEIVLRKGDRRNLSEKAD